ncbi:hypothetical protein [Pseudoxanthomonas wuyuanensis]
MAAAVNVLAGRGRRTVIASLVLIAAAPAIGWAAEAASQAWPTSISGIVSTFGTDVMNAESTLPDGGLLEDVVCIPNGTPAGSRSDRAYTRPGPQIDASTESTCTSVPTVNLSIAKGANPTAVRSSQPVTYTFQLDNDGPGPGDGVVFRDPAVTGVDCSAATLMCSASGGATCPATLDVASLQGTGLVIPIFPAGGALQLMMSCTVTAEGL